MVFEKCHAINDLLKSGREADARSELIKLLAVLHSDGLEYSPLINCLIREVGLFPYIKTETSSWQERYVCEVFKADVGEDAPITLHREQSRLLNALLSGENIAVSAPTSFGKSFVIDSFISIKKPKTVVIIVPTIALADETRRRLHGKFGRTHKIITTTDQRLAENNILIFPQERAIGYVDVLEHIDILIVDEFYKASKEFDKERSPALIRSIMRLSRISDQRYFLAPNISELRNNVFTEGMKFLRLDFNTVFLEKTNLYSEIGKDQQKKSEVLLRLLSANPGKTLIYAGTYTNIDKISTLLMNSQSALNRGLLNNFQSWLGVHYDPNWALTNLISRGVGIHNGRLHRSLSQIQVRLFEEEQGLDRIISTSSIIEGVNTSAENVILWSNKNGTVKIDDFTYKNIIGRGGRMLKHFVGKIFILDKPPAETNTQLNLVMPEELLGTMGEDLVNFNLTPEQLEVVAKFKSDMLELVSIDDYEYFHQTEFQTSNSELILNIVRDIKVNPTLWNGLGYLNSNNPENWDRLLYRLMNFLPGEWGGEYNKYVRFVKILYENWKLSIPELLQELNEVDIGIDLFFNLERITTFQLAALLSDVHTIYNRLNRFSSVDLTHAISRFSHAFLPKVVYQLEEYGLPRMISKKIHATRILDLENPETDVHEVIEKFRAVGFESLLRSVGDLDDFDKYILRYFYDGVEYRGTLANA